MRPTGRESDGENEQAHRVFSIRRVIGLVLLLALAGCGGKAKSPAARIADCLNGKGFLVQPATGQVVGTSPRGIAFRVTIGGRIADGGNPGGRRLSGAERRTIRSCLH